MERLSRKEQKERTRGALVEGATKLFSKKGIAFTTTADVAKSLDVSHGTLFLHFPTRDDLILAVVDEFGRRLSEELGAKVSSDLNLKQMLHAHVSVLAEFEDFYLRLISESQSLPPNIRSLVYAMNSSLSYRFFKAAQQLMKEQTIKKFDQPTFFNTWMAQLHFQIMNRDLFSDRTPILKHKGDEIVRHFFQLIKKGDK